MSITSILEDVLKNARNYSGKKLNIYRKRSNGNIRRLRPNVSISDYNIQHEDSLFAAISEEEIRGPRSHTPKDKIINVRINFHNLNPPLDILINIESKIEQIIMAAQANGIVFANPVNIYRNSFSTGLQRLRPNATLSNYNIQDGDILVAAGDFEQARMPARRGSQNLHKIINQNQNNKPNAPPNGIFRNHQIADLEKEYNNKNKSRKRKLPVNDNNSPPPPKKKRRISSSSAELETDNEMEVEEKV